MIENTKKKPRLIISAANSGTGKTTITIALMDALRKKGITVQPYKVGPDYIDPKFHEAVTGRSSVNLDGWLLEESNNKYLFNKNNKDADISIIEGVMGLYDGYDKEPMIGSTAQISKMLKTPIILVMNAKGMSTSAAAVVYGMKNFGDVLIKGIIINCPASIRHYEILKETIEKHTNVQVLGYLPRLDEVQFESRHLGLIQSEEIKNLNNKIDKLSSVFLETVDINKLIEIANDVEALNSETIKDINDTYNVDIAVARDKAFSFHYRENIEILKELGAKIHYFSPIKDESLPSKCDGIYLVGGYPEVFAKELSDNYSLMKQIKEKADEGLPIYAECGGYMYLHETITTLTNETYKMAGVFSGGAYMKKRLQNFGYATIKADKDSLLFNKGDIVKIHEFHRSVVDREDEQPHVVVSKKEKKWYCGKAYKNVYGMYPHIYFPTDISIPRKFIKKIYLNKYKNNGEAN
ncbi:MAG: cobyrinate a,c-diamide synthase [Vallitalea sp.]|jgi:cobyrinic acid a,c-diamide synthase|nr:cobyrinate a,c-diamide synthase [Vallitalea sp.]